MVFDGVWNNDKVHCILKEISGPSAERTVGR